MPAALEGLPASRKLVQWDCLGGLRHRFQQFFNSPDGVRRQQDIATDRADLGRDVVNHYNVSLMSDRMDDGSILIFTRTSLDCAFHGFLPLCLGATHFGGLGS